MTTNDRLTADKREIKDFSKFEFGNFFYPQTVRRHFGRRLYIIEEVNMSEEKHKIITITYPINANIVSELERLFSRYPSEDIFYKIENSNTIRIYLNQLDFSDFKKEITSRIQFTDSKYKLNIPSP